ncbi:MAG: hypothetical protein JXR94_15280 [Candidatus Hydrogenedentes bacterium]|nr:hypothetical protein [Candidatus Hydrogenedentota bacterium]
MMDEPDVLRPMPGELERPADAGADVLCRELELGAGVLRTVGAVERDGAVRTVGAVVLLGVVRTVGAVVRLGVVRTVGAVVRLGALLTVGAVVRLGVVRTVGAVVRLGVVRAVGAVVRLGVVRTVGAVVRLGVVRIVGAVVRLGLVRTAGAEVRDADSDTTRDPIDRGDSVAVVLAVRDPPALLAAGAVVSALRTAVRVSSAASRLTETLRTCASRAVELNGVRSERRPVVTVENWLRP